MGRFARPPRKTKLINTWLYASSKIPRYSFKDLEIYMKKLLKYYPKETSALGPITLGIIGEYYEDLKSLNHYRLEKLYLQVISKYKRDFLNHQNIDISNHGLLYHQKCASRSLRLIQSSKKAMIDPPKDLQRILKTKYIRHLELDGSLSCTANIIMDINYLTSLESLYIRNLPDMSQEERKGLRKFLLASRCNLETITLTGNLAINAQNLFQILLELPKLKKINIDGKFPSKFEFDIRQIPYKRLKKRNISYNIRVQYPKGEIKFTTKYKSGLVPIDFLGLDYRKKLSGTLVWDLTHEEHRKIQENAKRALCFSFPQIEPWMVVKLSKLFRSCKDIKILDICLTKAGYNWSTKGFYCLRYLNNLQHVFITLNNIFNWHPNYRYDDSDRETNMAIYDDFFKNLAFCAPKLKSINFHLDGEADLKDEILNFFEACSNTLTQVTFKFTYNMYANAKNMDNTYELLQRLKQITRLQIIYNDYNENRFDYRGHSGREIFTSRNLKEIALIAPSIPPCKVVLNFKHLTSLQKIQLDLQTLDYDSIFFPSKLLPPKSLKHLELSLRTISEKTWHKLLAQFDTLRKLEILMLKVDKTTIFEKAAINDLKLLAKNSNSLKLIVYGGRFDSLSVCVLLENHYPYSSDDVDNFFGRNLEGVPCKRLHKIYAIRKEMKEGSQVHRRFFEYLKNPFTTIKYNSFGSKP